jgi:hypothetical protein
VVLNGTAVPRTISFMDGAIEQVEVDQHLGFKFGNVPQREVVESMCREMTQKTNMLKAHFSRVPHDTAYVLFKTYCMPLYGCVLLDLNDRSMERLFVTWRKCIRSLLALPLRTHSHLLHLICSDIPIYVQIYCRFIKFLRSLTICNNHLVSLCLKLALRGSRSKVANSISLMSQKFNVRRDDVPSLSLCGLHDDDDNDDDLRKSGMICELLDERWCLSMPFEQSFLNAYEINAIIEYLCVV